MAYVTNDESASSGPEQDLLALAAGLAHEIKNPLSTIRLNMELLCEDIEESESPRERRLSKRIDIVRRECERLQTLLDAFLNFAKARPARLEPADLNAEMDSLLEFCGPEFRDSGIEIQRYYDNDLPRVLIDREQMHGALLNLLINARQAMENGGELVIRTAGANGAVTLMIIDNGCGMDDRTASRMFEAFYTTKSGGSGLGLPTTARIIESHGGRIQVQSEVGRGTQFIIELPVPPRLADE